MTNLQKIVESQLGLDSNPTSVDEAYHQENMDHIWASAKLPAWIPSVELKSASPKRVELLCSIESRPLWSSLPQISFYRVVITPTLLFPNCRIYGCADPDLRFNILDTLMGWLDADYDMLWRLSSENASEGKETPK